MKASLIIKIFCWVVIAAVLLCVLIWGVTGSGIKFGLLPVSCNGLGSVNFDRLEGDAGAYAPSNAYSVPLGSIENINIDWIGGSVIVKPYDGSEISFTESSPTGIPEKYALRYAVSGSTLTIHYCEASLTQWNTFNNLTKKLELLVPQSLANTLSVLGIDAVSASVDASDLTSGEVELSTVSGPIRAANINARELELTTVSGSVSTESCAADRVETESVSGAVSLDGSFGEVHCNTVSGSTKVYSGICPAKASFESISGASTLFLPENNGFTARYDTVSGGFSCSFPTTSSNDRAVYGDGSASFSFESVSGSIRIEKIG